MLVGEQEQAARPARLGRDEHDLVAAERPRAQAHVGAGVLDVDVDAVLDRALVAHLLQPGRHASAAAGGGDDEIGAQLALLAAGRTRR